MIGVLFFRANVEVEKEEGREQVEVRGRGREAQ
jgi:hypothetical protein